MADQENKNADTTDEEVVLPEPKSFSTADLMKASKQIDKNQAELDEFKKVKAMQTAMERASGKPTPAKPADK